MNHVRDWKALEAGYPVTPDGGYFVVRGRLWRCSNPALREADRAYWVLELMRARSAVGRANYPTIGKPSERRVRACMRLRLHLESAVPHGGAIAPITTEC